jgi:prepilin-type N-terminal cleavage/methylation domain-containing protein
VKGEKAFTIIELLIVVIIIGVLATIAIPQFSKAVEKSKVGKAKSNLAVVAKAEAMAYAENGAYTAPGSLTTANIANLTAQISEVGPFLTGDADWTYTINAVGTSSFNAVATRKSGLNQNCALTYNGTTSVIGAANGATDICK